MIIVTRQGKEIVRESCRIFIESDEETGSHFVWAATEGYPLSWFGSRAEAEAFVKKIAASKEPVFYIMKEEQ